VLGLEAYSHTFGSAVDPLTQQPVPCTNVHGVLRADRGDGKESILLVTPVQLSSGRTGEGPATVPCTACRPPPPRMPPSHAAAAAAAPGVKPAAAPRPSPLPPCGADFQQSRDAAAFVLALGHAVLAHLGRVPWLAKDVIWVIPDASCGLVASVDAWVATYQSLVRGLHTHAHAHNYIRWLSGSQACQRRPAPARRAAPPPAGPRHGHRARSCAAGADAATPAPPPAGQRRAQRELWPGGRAAAGGGAGGALGPLQLDRAVGGGLRRPAAQAGHVLAAQVLRRLVDRPACAAQGPAGGGRGGAALRRHPGAAGPPEWAGHAGAVCVPPGARPAVGGACRLQAVQRGRRDRQAAAPGEPLRALPGRAGARAAAPRRAPLPPLQHRAPGLVA
jgi:hypothetical protein